MSILTELGKYIPGQPNYGQSHHFAAFTTIAAATTLAIKTGSAFAGSGARKREEKSALAAQQKAESAFLNDTISNPLINPAEGVTNTAAGLTNQFQNLRTSTEAAQLQQRGVDQNIANLADKFSAAGGGAGTATALARAAAQSNQNITAGLAQESARNQLYSAQGAANVDQLKAAGEARRQNLITQGNQYITGLREQREYNEQDKLAALLSRSDNRLGAARKARQDATSNQFNAITSLGTTLAGPGGTEGLQNFLSGNS